MLKGIIENELKYLYEELQRVDREIKKSLNKSNFDDIRELTQERLILESKIEVLEDVVEISERS